MTHLFRIFCSVFLVFATTLPTLAHEFWINPRFFQVAPGKEIRADFRNGENFDGGQLAYFSRSSKNLQALGPDGLRTLTPRDGDKPAISIKNARDGLYVLAHETTMSRLTYKEWAKWQKFVKHKDLGAVAANHAARGLPDKNFKEGYTRHVKALVSVGNGEGKDRRFGQETEFVALTNPYAAAYKGTMQVQLYYDGKKRGGAQVEIFERAPNKKVRILKTRTNGSGVAAFKTKPDHEYLIDAVVLREPRSGDKRIVWETLWAGLVFAHPAN